MIQVGGGSEVSTKNHVILTEVAISLTEVAISSIGLFYLLIGKFLEDKPLC